MRKLATWLLPAALTLLAVVWAVAAIGDTLTAVAHPVFAYSVAGLYDAVWLYALAQETAHRRQGSSALLPKVIGWVFLPLTVAILAVHGLMAGDVLAAIVGALVPVLAKMTLVMAVDRDTTRISPKAQAAIDRTRAVTRDRIAVSRALAASRSAETVAAAAIVKHTRKADAQASVTVHAALTAHAEIVGEHGEADGGEAGFALVSDHELQALLSGRQPRPEAGEAFGDDLQERERPQLPASPPSAAPVDVGEDCGESAPQEGTEELPAPPARKPVMDDEELYEAGFALYRSLNPPRGRNKFIAAMRESGHSASDSRLSGAYKRIQAEISDLSVDAITADTDRETEGQS
jgi:putative effector of murein hydrolase LrgA (UPF0299 family)